MQIDHYSFGRIGIDGHSYDADVIVFPDHVQECWRRRATATNGGRVFRKDLIDILKARPISLHEQGRQDVQRLADFLGRAGVRIEQVLHSGKTRAEQTAAMLADQLLPSGKPQPHAGLGPNDPLEKTSPEPDRAAAGR